MYTENDLLLQSAARLYSLGIELDGARAHLHQLVATGTSYDSSELLDAYREYRHLKELWDMLESDHLALRNELLSRQ